MKLALLVCLMVCTTAVHGLDFAELFVKFFDKWIPVGQDIDVMMLLDSSDSVGETNFQKGLDGIVFTNEMIDDGNPIGPTRSGYIQFSSKENTAIKIHLPTYNTIGALTAALNDQTYEGVMTAMAKALRLAKKEFFNINPHPNPNRPRRVLLVTDGKETEGGNPVQRANKLKKKDVEICVVGIGNNINENVLKNIATEYYIFWSKKLGFRWEPCYVEAKDWIEYKREMRKAFRLLKKSRKGKGN